MLSILIDRHTIQGRAHLQWKRSAGLRLRSFIELISAQSGQDVALTEGTITRESLRDCPLLIVPTRKVQIPPEEVDTIEDYVLDSGNLLLMSNHHPHHDLDTVIGERFGIRFEETHFCTGGGLTKLSGNCLTDHLIIAGKPEEKPVEELVTNTTCSIVSEGGEDIAFLSDTMQDRVKGLSPAGKRFAVSKQIAGGGRIVAMADSGFIGTNGTVAPGIGLIDKGDNTLFVKRVVRWLLE